MMNSKVIGKHAPWKLKPWITKGIQNSIKTKNMFYGKYKRTNHKFWFNQYKLYKNNSKILDICL